MIRIKYHDKSSDYIFTDVHLPKSIDLLNHQPDLERYIPC